MASMAALLEASGFRVRGRRASCPRCEGRSRWTVSVDEQKGVAYCHRCQFAVGIRKLAREQGVVLPARRRALAREKKEQFRKWLTELMGRAASEERVAYEYHLYARNVLRWDPENQPAWDLLAEWYHRERSFQQFWEQVTCRAGRYELYRTWRKRRGIWKPSPLGLLG